MNFIMFDLGLLVAFAIIVSLLLYRKRSKINREGLMVLFRTQWGTRLIEKIGGKYTKTLKFLSYVSIGVGSLLMVSMIWLFYKVVYLYLYQQQIVKAIKIPPIMPLVPYVDKIVPGIPPVYFIYFIFILAAIAIPHEFFHGIFMKRYNVKIKSTGFGFFPFFFPVLPLAFVEQEQKSFEKSSRFEQMAVLSAGTFANVIVAILFFIILLGFFAIAFAPAGVQFDTYAYKVTDVDEIYSVNGVQTELTSSRQLIELMDDNGFNEIRANNKDFIATKEMIQIQNSSDELLLYFDSPAINSNLSGIIKSIDGVSIDSKNALSREIGKHAPGDIITLELEGEDIYNYDIELGSNPDNPDDAWLGVGFINVNPREIMGKILSVIAFKETGVYYESKIDGWSIFIYNLLWWIAVASISVALVNMLPIGGLDGGRFLYLGLWCLTGKEKFSKRVYLFVTYILLLAVAVMMLFWAKSFF